MLDGLMRDNCTIVEHLVSLVIEVTESEIT